MDSLFQIMVMLPGATLWAKEQMEEELLATLDAEGVKTGKQTTIFGFNLLTAPLVYFQELELNSIAS